MTVDLNSLPYFDDFDEKKNFHKIIFKPGVAVQARELTQLQTILQNQIERFGDHIFKNGSRVLGGTFDPQDPVDYVRVQENLSNISNIVGAEITGSVTGLKARVVHAEEDPTELDVTVLYLNYTDSNNSENITTFTNETLSYVTPISSGALTPTTTNITGKGSVFGITEGVLYVDGYFVRFDRQKIAVDPFNSRASKRVYFKAEFTVVDSNVDVSLLDNAQGYNNFNAPGADRLKCELSLNVSDVDVDLSDDSNFLLLEIRDGQIFQKNEKTLYSEIADELARRTFNESGDYVVRGWDVNTREHLNTGTNGGKFSLAEGGDPNKISVELEKGLAYVKGYEIETVATKSITTDKATDYISIDNQTSFVSSGPHVIGTEIMGLPNPNSFVEVNIYDTAEARGSNGISSGTTPYGNKIGSARLISYIAESGTLGTPEATIRFYIADLVMNTGQSFANARAIGNSDFFADIQLDSGSAAIYDSLGNSRLIYVGENAVRSVKNQEGNSNLSVTFMKQNNGAISTGGQITGFVSLGTNETLIYGTNTLGSLAKESIFLTITEGAVVEGDGTVSTVEGSPDVSSVSANFNKLNVGDRLRIDNSLYVIESIQSNSELTLKTNVSSTFTGAWTKEYVAGDLIDLNSKGYDTGLPRVVESTPTSLSIDIGETLLSETDCKLSYRVVKNPASERSKVIRPQRYVKINGATASNLNAFYLGVPDVFKIRQIRKHSSEISELTDGANVTSQFTLIPNANENTYNTSYVVTDTPISNTDHLLIEFDYFEADMSGSGNYFTVDSYPIDDTIESDTTLRTLDLNFLQRNYLDFRSVSAPTASPSTTIATAPTNPSRASSYSVPSGGYRAPVPGTNLTFDYSFYIGRKDILAVKPNGVFEIFKGQPSVYPVNPKVPQTYMIVANISIPPYPSLSENLAKILRRIPEGVQSSKVTQGRHTMADISSIKQRVKNLEYYTALNLMEKNTFDLIIPDENGLDRFKNGIFVNPFVDHTLSDLVNDDYNIGINEGEKCIQPTYDVEGFDTNYASGVNVTKTGNLVHLPFTEVVMKEQPFATSTRNIELSSYRFIGEMDLYPDVDTWVDTTTVDSDFQILEPEMKQERIVTSRVQSWKTTVSGAVSESLQYQVYDKNTGDPKRSNVFDGNETLVGKFDNASDAVKFVTGGRVDLQNARALSGDVVSSDLTALTQNDYIRSQVGMTGGENYHVIPQKVVTKEPDRVVTSTSRSTRVQTILVPIEKSYNIGSFVTEASIIPYIRPQTIKVYSYGLKPNTRFHIFFDGENMNEYATPVPAQSYFDEVANNTGHLDFDTDFSSAGEEGTPIFSNSKGEVLVFLRLPSQTTKRFRVGEKEIVLTDSPTNSNAEASSYSINTFVSSGLNLQKQNTILSTKNKTSSTTSVKTSSSSSGGVVSSQTLAGSVQQTSVSPIAIKEIRFDASCAAYSILIDEPDDVEGVFLSSVDIWLSELHPSLGIWFEIREMSSDGGITRNMVPYSKVWMNRDDPRLKISEDGVSNPTNVNFDSPVFLFNDTQYAFVIHTEGLNPDSYFWISRLGETDVSTGNLVTSRALNGTFYTTNNNLNWDMVPDIDLKIRFNRLDTGAAVNSVKTGTATFAIEDVEFISSNTSLPETFFNTGEPVRGSEILTIALDGASVIQIGDTITDSVTGASGIIVDIDGTSIYTNGFDFVANSAVVIYEGETETERNTGTVSTVDFGFGVMDKVYVEENRFDITHSNGKFFVGAKIRSVLPQRHKSVLNGTDITVTYSGADSTVRNPYAPTGVITLPVGLSPSSTTTVPEFTIDEFATFEFTSATIRPAYLVFSDRTAVSFEIVSNDVDTSESVLIPPNREYEYTKMQKIYSKSEELRLLNGKRSFEIKATIASDSNYITPVIDSSLMGVVFTRNNLNDDITGENSTSGGNLESKYISKVVKLTDINSAEDLQVLLEEYRPATSDIKVWARLRSSGDPASIRNRNWFEMDAIKNTVSSDVDKSDYIETVYTIPETMLTGDSESVQYTESGNLAVINGTEMVANTEYFIVESGTTDFTEYGSSSNQSGTVFTATGPSDGTGTVTATSEIVYTRFNEFQIKIGMYGSNPAVYPKAASLRAIALQK